MGRSLEFRRIEELPRRTLGATTYPDMTDYFRRPGGTMNLRPVQNAALIEAAEQNGGFFPCPVGTGKTLLTLLLPSAMNSQRAVLLVPSTLKQKTLREVDDVYKRHFYLPMDRISIVAYEELSSANHADILDRIQPDLIICDEAHKLRHRSASRTKRFLRYMGEHPGCRFVALSGTITTRSVKDFAHLIELALGKFSPLPRTYQEVNDWAGALDVRPEYAMAPGALRRFCRADEVVRDGFARRLVETPGVVASTGHETDLGASLLVCRKMLPVPATVLTHYHEAKENWSIAGEEFDSILTRGRVLRQIATGFFYRWVWPQGAVDYDWLDARNAWSCAVREKLKQSRKGMDSPLLLARAAEGGRWPEGLAAWSSWKSVRDRPPPPTEAVWLDDFLLRDAIDLAERAAKDSDGGVIVWYVHRAVGEKLGEMTRWPLYGAGTDASGSRDKIIIASIRAQGEGKNLQHGFSHNIFTSLPSSGTVFEQTVGRTHRPGQEADEVIVDWYAHLDECEAAMESIFADARYQQETTKQPQKILYATHLPTPLKAR